MDIIRKIIPKNPINASTQAKMQTAIKHTLEVFAKNYAKFSQLTIVKNKINEAEEEEKRKEIVKNDNESKTRYYKRRYGEDSEVPDIPEPPEKGASLEIMQKYCTRLFDLGFKPLRPRGKLEPLKPPELQFQITRFELMDEDVDPYAVYVISSSFGKLHAEKKRRFREFERLNKTLKKVLPKEAHLPESSKKFGGRNLDPNHLSEKMGKLNEYLITLSQCPEIQNDENFLSFLGVSLNKNPLDDQIFKDAFRRTKYNLCCWKTFYYDEPEDALSKLITFEVLRSIYHDILVAVPPNKTLRKASLKLAYKVISAAVDAAVPPAWKTAYSASAALRDKVQEALGKVIGIIIKKKNEINDQLKEKMHEFFTPIKEAFAKLLGQVVTLICPTLVKPFSPLMKTYSQKCEPLLIESFHKCDNIKLKEGVDTIHQFFIDLINKLKDEINDKISSAFGEIKAKVSLDIILDIFSIDKAVGILLYDLLSMIDPEHYSKIVGILFEYKSKLQNEEGNIDNILNEMERKALYYISWEYDRIDSKRYHLRYDLSKLELDSLASACFNYGKKFNKCLYKKVMKKFVYKFGDYVWGARYKKSKNEINEINEKSWFEEVDEAFIIAYNAAKKKFNKELGIIIKDGVCSIIKGLVLDKVSKKIREGINSVLEKITGLIPENIKEMVDVEEMADDDISEVLESTLTNAVNDQEEQFVKIVEQSVEECQI